MPLTFTIHVAERIVVSTASAVVTFQDAKLHQDWLLSDPAFSDQFDQLLDFRRVTNLKLTPGEIRELASRPVFSPASRRAVVAVDDLSYGLFRMLETYYGHLPAPARTCVFRDLKAALQWLERENLSGLEL